MNCDFGVDGAEADGKIRYVNAELKDLTFKASNLIIIFFIIFIICASIALSEIKMIFDKLN